MSVNGTVDPCNQFRLIQEEYEGSPWKVMVATILLNRTKAEQALPVIHQLFERYQTREAMMAAAYRDVEAIINCLGLSKARAKDIINVAYRIGKEDVKVEDLPGIGAYGKEAYRMLVEKDQSFWPDDFKLCRRMIELKIDPAAWVDHRRTTALEVMRDADRVYAVTYINKQRDLVTIPLDHFERYYTPLKNGDGTPYPLKKVLEKFLDDQFIKLTERGKEIIMFIAVREGAVIGKFEDGEAAKAACPEGTVLISGAEGLKELSVRAITELYNSLVTTDEERVAKFANKAEAVEKTMERLEGHDIPVSPAPSLGKGRTKQEKPKKELKEKTISDRDRVRAFLAAGAKTAGGPFKFKIEEAAAACGRDTKTTGVIINLLTNADRNKVPLKIVRHEDDKKILVYAPVEGDGVMGVVFDHPPLPVVQPELPVEEPTTGAPAEGAGNEETPAEGGAEETPAEGEGAGEETPEGAEGVEGAE